MNKKRGHNFRGLWINFEGGEGCGKGTQIDLLNEYLKSEGFDVKTGREPGGTFFGEQLRILLQNPEIPSIHPKTELSAYFAAGTELFYKVIEPWLKKGGIFTTDRWRFSTLAYQGYGLGMDLDIIDKLIRFFYGDARPDLTFLIDIPPEKGLANITGHEFEGHYKDKIEARELKFHQRVREGYLEIAKKNPESFVVIQYQEGNINGMQRQIQQAVNEYIGQFQLRDKLLRTNPSS